MRATPKGWARALSLEGVLKRAWLEARMLGERGRFLLQGRPEPSAAIVLASSGRSGSTWLADLLSLGGTQQIFEPLHPRFNRRVERMTAWYGARPYTRSYYLRAGGDYPEWRELWEEVLAGRSRSHWTDQRRTSLFPKRYLIKVIRANLMLGFAYDLYRPRIVCLVRHPCAVVHSRLMGEWHADVADILDQEALVEEYLRPWLGLIEREQDLLGAHAVWWAVENSVAMRELATRPHCPVFYEELVLGAQGQLDRILGWLGVPAHTVSTDLVETPSRVSRRGPASAELIPADHWLRAWQQALAPHEQRRILDWAHRLGIACYNDRALPVQMLDGPGGND
jgi:hypothetical protein